jgi:succinate dehydrogenase / fumarate reductase cytochrome b subunit
MSTVAITPIHRVVRFYEAPIGKKFVMALTGVMLFGYVVAHLLGNLQIYAGRDQINHYAAFLHNPANAGLLWGARLVLLIAVGMHIVSSLQLWRMQRVARPQGYVKKDDPAASYASRTMMWSGPIVAAFVIFHVLHLTAGAVVPLHPGHDSVVHAPVPRAVEHVPVARPLPSAVHADAQAGREDRGDPDRCRQHIDSACRDGRSGDEVVVGEMRSWN